MKKKCPNPEDSEEAGIPLPIPEAVQDPEAVPVGPSPERDPEAPQQTDIIEGHRDHEDPDPDPEER